MSSPGARETVVIAPFSNERVREWPLAHFGRYIDRVLREQGARVLVVGTRAQRPKANALARSFSSADVVNACGTMGWAGLVASIDAASSVVANNSGVAHLAASRDRWTLCVFASSHSWLEWMPRGRRVVVITRLLPCVPCDLSTQLCPNRLACINELDPDVAFEQFRAARRAGPSYLPDQRSKR
jgi:ADP-heptose:LPS heptosyltransferase